MKAVSHIPWWKLFYIFSFVYPFFVITWEVYSGSFPFWVDPARDLQAGLQNLQKPTLIGPPSGIQGVFYGPYWVWLLSIGLVFSKDPRVPLALVLTLPYLIIFPLVLWQFKKIFAKKILLFVWLLFILSYSNLATHLWNIHPAPLLFLLLSYLIIIKLDDVTGTRRFVLYFFIGAVSGLIVNFHLSFGIVITLATVIFFIYSGFFVIKKVKKEIILQLIVFFAGFIVTFTPFLLFEIRHKFVQTSFALEALSKTSEVTSNTLTGLNKRSVFELFFGKLTQLLQIPPALFYPFYLVLACVVLISHKRNKITFLEKEKQLLLFFIICSVTILGVYSLSRNPIWTYHLVGVEIIMLFLVGFLISKIRFLYIACVFWLLFLLSMHMYQTGRSFFVNADILSSYATKKKIVETIYQDTKGVPFMVYAYSPSLHTEDFDYLFDWYGRDIYHNTPNPKYTNKYPIYLIIPKTGPLEMERFIKQTASHDRFRSDKQWVIQDGTIVLKRVKINDKNFNKNQQMKQIWL